MGIQFLSQSNPHPSYVITYNSSYSNRLVSGESRSSTLSLNQVSTGSDQCTMPSPEYSQVGGMLDLMLNMTY